MSGFSSGTISYTLSFWEERKHKYEELRKKADEAERRLNEARPGSAEEFTARGLYVLSEDAIRFETHRDVKEWKKGLRRNR